MKANRQRVLGETEWWTEERVVRDHSCISSALCKLWWFHHPRPPPIPWSQRYSERDPPALLQHVALAQGLQTCRDSEVSLTPGERIHCTEPQALGARAGHFQARIHARGGTACLLQESHVLKGPTIVTQVLRATRCRSVSKSATLPLPHPFLFRITVSTFGSRGVLLIQFFPLIKPVLKSVKCFRVSNCMQHGSTGTQLLN